MFSFADHHGIADRKNSSWLYRLDLTDFLSLFNFLHFSKSQTFKSFSSAYKECQWQKDASRFFSAYNDHNTIKGWTKNVHPLAFNMQFIISTKQRLWQWLMTSNSRNKTEKSFSLYWWPDTFRTFQVRTSINFFSIFIIYQLSLYYHSIFFS